MYKSFFTNIFVKNGSIYVKPRPKWQSANSIHHRIHFTSGNSCDNCL